MIMNVHLRRIRTKVKSMPKLGIALGCAVVVAMCLTVVSILIYYGAGFYKFDLSRPGYEKERSQVTNDSNSTPKNYDTTSPITSKALDDFLRDYDTGTSKATAYGDFRDQSLSDTELRLGE